MPQTALLRCKCGRRSSIRARRCKPQAIKRAGAINRCVFERMGVQVEIDFSHFETIEGTLRSGGIPLPLEPGFEIPPSTSSGTQVAFTSANPWAMDRLLPSLRYAIRLLLKSPEFTVTAVLILGFGIGINTAIFSLINATMLRPLPFPEPEPARRGLYSLPTGHDALD